MAIGQKLSILIEMDNYNKNITKSSSNSNSKSNIANFIGLDKIPHPNQNYIGIPISGKNIQQMGILEMAYV